MREATGREMDQFTVISSVEEFNNEDELHKYGIWTRGGRHNLGIVEAANRYEAVAMFIDATGGARGN